MTMVYLKVVLVLFRSLSILALCFLTPIHPYFNLPDCRAVHRQKYIRAFVVG